MTKPGTLTIHGIAADCIIGDLAWERTTRQPIRCDVSVDIDCARVHKTDQRADTVDYVAVTACVRTVLEHSQFQMIEVLADTIAENILEQFSVARVALTITKHAHFPGADHISFHIERTR